MQAVLDAREAYQGVEAAQNFSTTAELEAYRSRCLAKTEAQSRYCTDFLSGQERVLEIGCGNGRLLVQLAHQHQLSAGLGIDVAASRIAFATQWTNDLGLDAVLTFATGDVLAEPDLDGSFDLIVCMTGAFGYFEALKAGGDKQVLAWLGRHAQCGSRLVLELYQYPDDIRQCQHQSDATLRRWVELPPEDPFRFYLHKRAEPARLPLPEKSVAHWSPSRSQSIRHRHNAEASARSIRSSFVEHRW